MGNMYRCMKCGNNLTAMTDDGLECPKCGMSSGFKQVTEENKTTLPHPTHLYEYSKQLEKDPSLYNNLDGIDPNFCNDLDGSKEGICPCGVFTAHLINRTCNLINTAIPKEPLYPTCQCKAAVSLCGHSISHRLIDACTGQP